MIYTAALLAQTTVQKDKIVSLIKSQLIQIRRQQQAKLKVIYMPQRQYKRWVQFKNDSSKVFDFITIQHRHESDDSNPTKIEIKNLFPGQVVGCQCSFSQKSTVVAGIFASVFTLGISNIWKDWGKDYWIIHLKEKNNTSIFKTNNHHFMNQSKDGDKWFADIERQDKEATFTFRSVGSRYQVALNRHNHNGQSTRYLND